MAGQTAGRRDISEVRRKLWSYWNSKPDCGGSAKQRKLRAPFVRLVIQYLIRMRFFGLRQRSTCARSAGFPVSPVTRLADAVEARIPARLRYPEHVSCKRPTRDHELIQIVDAALADAARRAGDWLACRPGCTQCCIGAFAINSLDAARLRAGMSEVQASHAELATRVLRR